MKFTPLDMSKWHKAQEFMFLPDNISTSFATTVSLDITKLYPKLELDHEAERN